MVRTIYFKKNMKSIALRRRPYIPEMDNESDVTAYIKPEEYKSVKRIDDEIYYDYTDDEYYRVNLPDGRYGFINRLAFEEVGTNGSGNG